MGARGWAGLRGRRRGTLGERLQIAGPDVAEERKMLSDGEDDRHRPRAVQLRLEEIDKDLLQLMDAGDRIDARARGFGGGGLERLEGRLGDHRRRDRVGQDEVFQLIDLVQGQRRAFQRRLERVVEHDQRRHRKVDDDDRDGDMDENSEQAVDAPNRLETMERPTDRASDRAQDDREDEGHEHAQHRVDVQELLHLARVLVVESKDQKERGEEEDLRHQRLDHATLVSEEQRHEERERDDGVDDHAVLAFHGTSSRRASMTRKPPNMAMMPAASLSRWATYTPFDCR